jgi:ABC-type uncharacterized transport system permease subunit
MMPVHTSSVSVTLHFLTAVLYALSSAFYFALLLRGSHKLGHFGAVALGFGATSHVLFVLWRVMTSRSWPSTIYEALSWSALWLAVFFLLAGGRFRNTVLGSFVAPMALLFFLATEFGRHALSISSPVRSVLLVSHITSNVLGIAAFAVASASSIGYLLQDAILRKRKSLLGIGSRLPPLDVLDSIGMRAVAGGFVFLTLGILSGSLWASQAHGSPFRLSASHWFAVLAWAIFAGVLVLRQVVGWGGRRAATGTVIGFVCALGVLIGYVARTLPGVGFMR